MPPSYKCFAALRRALISLSRAFKSILFAPDSSLDEESFDSSVATRSP